MSEYRKVEIGAHSQEQVDAIRDALMERRLITGGPTTCSPARFWWQGAFQDCEYWISTSWTLATHVEAITAIVAEVSSETVPIVCFMDIEGNPGFLGWIRQAVG